MADREKVISGLQRCRLINKVNCDKCLYDYNGRGNGKSECTAELADDALALLKEQQKTIKRLQDKLFANPDAWIHCKDCKWHDNPDKSTKWLPCMEIRTLNNWFCADGERRD